VPVFPAISVKLVPEFSVAKYWRSPKLGQLQPSPSGFFDAARDRGVRYWGVHPCGTMSFRLSLPEYTMEDMAPVITAAYRTARFVTVETFATIVSVDTYPEGHFGDLVRDGMLVMDRTDMTKEEQLAGLFAVLMEAINTPQAPSDEIWLEMPEDYAPHVDQYRREPGFVPDLAFNFAGEVPLRGELSLEQGRLLLVSGNHWASYELDYATTRRLVELLAEALGRRESEI